MLRASTSAKNDVAPLDERVVKPADLSPPHMGRESTGSSTRTSPVNRPTQPARSCAAAARGDRSNRRQQFVIRG